MDPYGPIWTQDGLVWAHMGPWARAYGPGVGGRDPGGGCGDPRGGDRGGVGALQPRVHMVTSPYFPMPDPHIFLCPIPIFSYARSPYYPMPDPHIPKSTFSKWRYDFESIPSIILVIAAPF